MSGPRGQRRMLQVLGKSGGGVGSRVAEVVEGLDGQEGLVLDIAGPSDLPMPMPKPTIPLVVTVSRLIPQKRLEVMLEDVADRDITAATDTLRRFIDPVLDASVSDRWDPRRLTWIAGDSNPLGTIRGRSFYSNSSS